MDIKTWLEESGMKAAETAFKKPPPFPYIVFLDHVKRGGADMKNMIKHHELQVERYSEFNDDSVELEALFDEKALEYTKEKQWLDSEKCFMTRYEFEILEREVI
ncbi:hypothetical protein [Clostridium felsineum]|uniref:Uncharacterized protein n=1 Tax=Clostridium felsineum TaxID=36839 RepID=A0A1S8LYS3_9CLOT|nr:hypothetical protein [Clostridium felsineum]URZ07541.1 hypothetical protein CLROS_028800 [Clostridium felsineum]URZ12572.1 hypothetical protein CROST_032950 [Clostridium felsineum]